MPNHQAVEQMLGYLYQIRYALYLLLNADDERSQISIEKFDDIAFGDDMSAKILIQLKHHVKSTGNLTDASTDMWRTLNVWIDQMPQNDKQNFIDQTKFLIITTALAPIGSAAYYLSPNPHLRNTAEAYNLLQHTAIQSTNKEHQKYYSVFIQFGEQLCKHLLNSIYIIDGSTNIVNTENSIRKEIKYAANPEYEDNVLERLEGWWFRKAIQSLCSIAPVFISQNQVRSHIIRISQEYAEDNLPIDIPDYTNIGLHNLEESERIFIEQLNLIKLNSTRVNIAIRDYYKAFKQRANWIRDDLLYIDELETYERKLIDEWDRQYSDMKEDILDNGNEITDQDKIKKGRDLFRSIDKEDIRIRDRCNEPFVMRGTYHILANQLDIGWHINFFDRLKHLLVD